MQRLPRLSYRHRLSQGCGCPRRRSGGLLTSLLVLLVMAGALTGSGLWYWQKSRANAIRTDLIVEAARRGPFDHIVLEQGELESTSNVDIMCRVRSRGGSSGTALLWVIDEGTAVEAGEKLVELDSSALEMSLKEKRVVVIGAEANVAAAEALVEQAKIARQEYLEGLYDTDEKLILSEMAIAEQSLRKAQLALNSSERLVAKGLVKALQLEADQFAVANARNQLEGAQNRLRVLQNLTRQKMLVQFDSAIDSAEAQLAAALGSLEEEQAELRDIQEQIDLCVITAPAAGVVIHANQYSSRGGNAEFVVEPGAIIRERQTILRLPDPKRMQVRAKVNESRITLISQGMPAKIRVDAVNNMELIGRVAKVNRYAEPGSWYSSSVKQYATTIEIIDPPDTIRTGMTAEVQIFVEQIPDALQVPIQAVYEHGGQTYSLVRLGDREFETREVTLGATNDSHASILAGIAEGEKVVLNVRQNLSLMDLPEIEREDNTSLAGETGGSLIEGEDGPSAGGLGPQGGRAAIGESGELGPRGAGPRDGAPREGGPRQGGPGDGGPRQGGLGEGGPGGRRPPGSGPGGPDARGDLGASPRGEPGLRDGAAIESSEGEASATTSDSAPAALTRSERIEALRASIQERIAAQASTDSGRGIEPVIGSSSGAE